MSLKSIGMCIRRTYYQIYMQIGQLLTEIDQFRDQVAVIFHDVIAGNLSGGGCPPKSRVLNKTPVVKRVRV